MTTNILYRIKKNTTDRKNCKITKERYIYRLEQLGKSADINAIVWLLGSDVKKEIMKIIIDSYLAHHCMTINELKITVVRYCAENLVQVFEKSEGL